MNENQETDIYQAVFNNAKEIVGVKLFTVMVLDRTEQTAKREFTSHPFEYPTSGSKPMHEDRWSRIVIDNHQVFIANTTEGFSDVFSDHELINHLGCESVVNIPILDNSLVIGTINFLHEENHFTDERVEALKKLVLDYTPSLKKAFGTCDQVKLSTLIF